MVKNKILEKRAAIEAALVTVDYQIKHLYKFYSREQVRCWRVHRKKLFNQLKGLPTVEMVQAGAKRINFSNSPIPPSR